MVELLVRDEEDNQNEGIKIESNVQMSESEE